jgi:hypothetical protein
LVPTKFWQSIWPYSWSSVRAKVCVSSWTSLRPVVDALSRWAKASQPEGAEEKKGLLGGELEKVAWALTGLVPEKMESASFLDLMTGLGIVTDKVLLLSGMPTRIVEVRRPADRREKTGKGQLS